MIKTSIVVGAGIAGLATARALVLKGFDVTIIEGDHKAVGASIRNFGMIWPVGQPSGKMYNRAIRSKNVWKEIAEKSGMWYNENGSLHLAYHADEWQVLQELYAAFTDEGRPVLLLNAEEAAEKSNVVNQHKLIGGLYSSSEMVIDPRDAIATVAAYLHEQHNIKFIWGSKATKIRSNKVFFDCRSLEADLICVCSGADFETLYPDQFKQLGITKCKLQMMRFKSNEANYNVGPSLCGGLSLIHYKSFISAASLPALQERYKNEMPEYIKNGIHVMVSQNNKGELTVGDSHQYGLSPDPFDSAEINTLITSYLKQFVLSTDWQLLQTWNGIYPKMLNGDTDIFISPEEGVYILNGLGGAGMTLSFGFAEEMIETV